MKHTIHNPNTVNHLLYVFLIVLFAVFLCISNILPKTLDGSRTFLSEVILNLSYGCIASTVVAWLIDCANTRNSNKQANSHYDAVYLDLKVKMAWFLDTWARICNVCFDDEDYANIYHTWHEWYSITKDRYQEVEVDRQKEIMQFCRQSLSDSAQKVIATIESIRSQSYFLTLNQLMNTDINSILSDYQFEFNALNMWVSREDDDTLFWEHMDVIAKDLINYINNWSDIKFYNSHEFKPYRFFEWVISSNHDSSN